MPLITAAYLAFAAGLLMGFGGVVVGGLALAAAGFAGAMLRRRPRLAALAAIAAAGIFSADASQRLERRCLATFDGEGRWTVDLEEAAEPGAFVRATVHGTACALPAAASVREGHASAGDRVQLAGQAVRSDRGVLIRNATVSAARPGSVLRRWRAAAGAAIDRTFRDDAPLAKALLVADTRGITPDVRDRYAAAGLVHMLSISGLHVAIIAMAIQLVLCAVRLPVRIALIGTVAVTAGYVVLIGAPAPAVRSAAMLAVGAASRIAQRPTSPWAALAVGALLPLWSPATVLDLGYQLSVVGMAALTASGELSRRVLTPRLDGWRLALAREATTSIVATMVSAPLVAWGFGRVSLVGPVSNLLAAPLMSVIQPMLFLGLLASPCQPVARFVADAAHPLLTLFDGIAAHAAAVPGGSLAVAPTAVSAALCSVAAGAAIVACVSRFPGRASVVAAAAITAAVWCGYLTPAPGGLEMHMIDVGQGDAIALRTPRGRWVLVDAGRSWNGGDAGRSTVIPYLRQRGGDLEGFVLSHPHSDHVGGAASVVLALHPRDYWDAAFAQPNQDYRASLLATQAVHAAWHRVHPGDSTMIDGVVFRFLAPDSTWTVALTDPNLASTVLLVRYGDVRFLLTGDAEAAEEAWVLAHTARGDLRADVLKVGHHGSRTSSTPQFLAAVQPRIALVSVGRGNTYGHPSPEIMAALAARGASVLRTDELGSIVVRTDGRRLTVTAGDETWEVPRD